MHTFTMPAELRGPCRRARGRAHTCESFDADEMGYALGLAQLGARHPNAKPWKGEGPGILEIVENHRGDTYRAVYAVRFADVVYVLHAFQKKSKQGIKTPQADVKLIKERLKRAQADYESRGTQCKDHPGNKQRLRRLGLSRCRGAADQDAPGAGGQ